MLLNSISKIALFLLCLSIQQVLAQQDQTVLLKDLDQINLQGNINALEDPAKSLSLEQLLNSSTKERFRPFNLANDSIGVTDSVWWFQFELDFSTIAGETRYLLLNNPLIFDARLYQVENGKLIELYRGGFAFPANERAVFDTGYVFPLKNQSSISQYYLRINNSGALQVPLSVWKPEALAGKKNTSHWILGIYYGLIISMAIYNLFIGWSTNVKAYFYYVGYLFSLAMTMAFNDGYAQLFFIQDSPHIAYTGINLASALVVIFACQFARDFLQTSVNTPLIDKWLSGNMIAAFLFLVTSHFFSNATAANIIIALVLIFISSMFTVGILCWKKKVRAARYFVFSWVFMVLGTFMMALTKLGQLPAAAIGEYGTHIGSAIEAMLLSFALAARISWLEEQRVIAEKKTRQALEASHKKLEESNRVKDEFFSLLSHELRTPMNGIRGIVDLFSQDKLNDKQTQNLKLLSESTDEMLGHVDQLLVFSQLKSDHLKLNQRPFNLIKLLERLETHCHIVCNEKKVSFEIDYSQLPVNELIGDERVLFVILNQLLEKHIKHKGLQKLCLTIIQTQTNKKYNNQLTFKLMSQCSKEVTALESNNSTQQKSNTIASDFFHSELSSKGNSLSSIETILHNKLVHLLHGELIETETSNNNFQTSLTLSFKQVVTQPQYLTKNKSIRKCRALVVDDNSVNRIVASKYLEQLGCEVDTASDGEEALHALKSSVFHFILMDCHMPVLNGFKTTILIRQGQVAPQIPIIAVTADVTAESTQECLNCGMNEVLHKPLRLDVLSEALKKQGVHTPTQPH